MAAAVVSAEKPKTATVVVAVCIALAMLSMGPPAAMADIQDDCVASCAPKCDVYACKLCSKVVNTFRPALNLLYSTCSARLNVECTHTCVAACSLNTLTPPDTPPPPPPGKQY
ncbi:hypothetical protein BS78_05G228600 [Paspalum vaginatum]|nr:hypothetical protein BS78_05G228600 [Paspalum vaginatum]